MTFSSFLVDMSSSFEFILFSVLLRVVEGIGSAGYSTALFTMATVMYPDSTGTVIVSSSMWLLYLIHCFLL